jgi:hypothetical protein
MAMEGNGSNIRDDVQEVMLRFFPEDEETRNRIRLFVMMHLNYGNYVFIVMKIIVLFLIVISE